MGMMLGTLRYCDCVVETREALLSAMHDVLKASLCMKSVVTIVCYYIT